VRTLVLDIETSPNLAYVWGLWQQNVAISQIASSTEVICFAAKWHGEKKVYFSRDMQDAFDMLHEADAVVTWNGDKFDIPHLNREFITRGMGLPSPYKSIDLLKTSRFKFKFPSNKLDYVAQALGVGAKLHHTGFQLWLDVMADDEKAWRLMERYNKQDVRITERVYDRMLPWIPSLPHPGLFDGGDCPACGSDHSERRGYAYTAVSTFQRFHCLDCGRWYRSTKRVGSVGTRG
jgi:RNase_H superfamily